MKTMHFFGLVLAPIVLIQGEQRILTIQNLKRYSLGGESVRAIKSPAGMQDSIAIKAVKPGVSTLLTWTARDSQSRLIRVEKQDASDIPLPLFRILQDCSSDVEVAVLGKIVVARGNVHLVHDAKLLMLAETQFPNHFQNETDLDDALAATGLTKLQAWLSRMDVSRRFGTNLQVDREGEALVLSGVVRTEVARQEIERQGRLLFPALRSKVVSREKNGGSVYFRVYLLELSHRAFRKLGIDWPLDGTPLAALRPWQVDPVFNIEATLKSLDGDGMAKVLANPELVVRAPGVAKLFAGGEIPIRNVGQYNSSVVWKPYGLNLILTVKNFDGDKIILDVSTEFSHLDPTTGIENVPGIKSNRMTTQVEAELGHPLLLAGLLQEKISEEVKGVPALRNIPILGRLFGSEEFLKQESELVAVLIPHTSLPMQPMKRVFSDYPRGPTPPPRNWMRSQEEARLKKNRDWPWNAL